MPNRHERLCVFRVDGGVGVGGGHAVRCMALSQTLRDTGWICKFAGPEEVFNNTPLLKPEQNEGIVLTGPLECEPEELASALPSGCDLLVIDHYKIERAYEEQCRSWAERILVIEDSPCRTHDCDILVDQTPGRETDVYNKLVPTHSLCLTGSKYILLRSQFREVRASRPSVDHTGEGVFLSFGAMDGQGLCVSTLNGLNTLGFSGQVDVMIGSASPHLSLLRETLESMAYDVRLHVDAEDTASIMANANFAVGAIGGMAWERCALGLPSLAIVVAENQAEGADFLQKSGGGIVLGRARDLSGQDIAVAVVKLLRDVELRKKMSLNASKICDGKGALRIRMALLPAESGGRNGLFLRLAESEDAEVLFDWQTSPGGRKYFVNPKPPVWKEHVGWLSKVLEDPKRLLCIVELDGQPSGVIRVDPYAGAAEGYEVSILIAPAMQGKGVGTAALALVRTMFPFSPLYAYILRANQASVALFRKAGYRSCGKDLYVSKP